MSPRSGLGMTEGAPDNGVVEETPRQAHPGFRRLHPGLYFNRRRRLPAPTRNRAAMSMLSRFIPVALSLTLCIGWAADAAAADPCGSGLKPGRRVGPYA